MLTEMHLVVTIPRTMTRFGEIYPLSVVTVHRTASWAMQEYYDSAIIRNALEFGICAPN
jgi:hypothetical protein